MISRGEISHLLDRADRPEPEHIAGDFFRFAIDWRCDERTYTTHIWARDAADAERRLQALRRTAVVVGQIKAERDCA